MTDEFLYVSLSVSLHHFMRGNSLLISDIPVIRDLGDDGVCKMTELIQSQPFPIKEIHLSRTGSGFGRLSREADSEWICGRKAEGMWITATGWTVTWVEWSKQFVASLLLVGMPGATCGLVLWGPYWWLLEDVK